MWIQNAKNARITTIASSLQYSRGNGTSIYPCPSCGLLERGSTDKKRGPVGFKRNEMAWMCHQCGAKGDVVDFVSHHFFQQPLRNIDKNQRSVVRDWFAEQGYCTPSGVPAHVQPDPTKRPVVTPPPTQGYVRPPEDELHHLWDHSTSVEAALHQPAAFSKDLSKWMIARRFSPKLMDATKCIRVLPLPTEYKYPEWFPHQWGGIFRIAAACFEPDGTFASIHVRSVSYSKGRQPSGAKTRWPLGYEAGGLLMANAAAQQLMRTKQATSIDGLLICEGITDYMRACEQAHRESLSLAIMAGTSGSFKSLGKMNIPNEMKVFIATDSDDSGDDYASEICDQLPQHTLYRVPLESIDG
jgi:5S rRNA maturation endonuclease (ribonuclease M5)|tara:strand:- start:2221 stop:3288 length:1068 start_codon:yes stop_codon:yes gene_type:complete